MNRRGAVVAAFLLVGAGAALGIALSHREVPHGSSLLHGPTGWLAARRYLMARGAKVSLRERPDIDEGDDPAESGPPGVWVMTFPWQRGATGDVSEAVDRHLRRGGILLLAYSGSLDDAAQRMPVTLEWKSARAVSLSPSKWRAQINQEWLLSPTQRDRLMLRVWAPREVPIPPPGAEIVFKTRSGLPAVSMFRRLRGWVVLLPADTLSNERLAEPGNADFLESLLARWGSGWTFEEYQHGFGVAVVEQEGVRIGRRVDIVLLHLVLLYGLAVFALARRQGPAWAEPVAAAGSAGGFLRGVGTLHERLRHDHAAAQRLLEHSRELDREVKVPAELERWVLASAPGHVAVDREQFLALARLLARWRRTAVRRSRV